MKKILITLVILIGLVAGWWFVVDTNEGEGNGNGLEMIGDIGFDVEAGFEIEDPGLPIPKLKRDVTGLTENTKDMLGLVRESLEEDHLQVDLWVQIGGLWKAGKNFEAAREAWEYAIALSPNNPVAPVNLGNLYVADIKNHARAEEWYLKAIEVAPTNVFAYTKLAELYLYQFDDRARAITTIESGLEILPGDDTLESFKSALEAEVI